MSLMRTIVKPFLRTFVRLGINASQALKSLRRMGKGYRKTDFLKDYAQASGYEQKASRIQSIPKSKYPTADTLTATPMLEDHNFSFKVELSGINDLTGEPDTCYVTVQSRGNMTPGDIEDLALEGYGRYADSRYLEAHTAKLTEGSVREGYWAEL